MHASKFQIWCQTPGEMIWCVTKTQDQIEDQILAAYLEQELSGQLSWNSLYYAFPFDAGKILRNEQLKEEARQSKGLGLERQPKREGAAAFALFRSLIVQTVIRIVGDKSAKMRLAKLSSQELSQLRNSTAEDAMLNDQINVLSQLFQLSGRRNVIFLECIDVLDADEIKGLLVPIQLLLARQPLQISVLISGYPDSDIVPQLSSIPTIDEMTEYYGK